MRMMIYSSVSFSVAKKDTKQPLLNMAILNQQVLKMCDLELKKVDITKAKHSDSGKMSKVHV